MAFSPHQSVMASLASRFRGLRSVVAAQVEVKRPDDQRDRYLSVKDLHDLKQALDDKTYRKGTKTINKTFGRLRLLVLVALTTGMRIAEIFGLCWYDVLICRGPDCG